MDGEDVVGEINYASKSLIMEPHSIYRWESKYEFETTPETKINTRNRIPEKIENPQKCQAQDT